MSKHNIRTDITDKAILQELASILFHKMKERDASTFTKEELHLSFSFIGAQYIIKACADKNEPHSKILEEYNTAITANPCDNPAKIMKDLFIKYNLSFDTVI